MDAPLENQRRCHEERERIMEGLVEEQKLKKVTTREEINSDQRSRQLLDRYLEVTDRLKDMYDDKDSMMADEIKLISGPNEFSEFYKRLRDIRDYHKRNPNQIAIPLSAEFAELKKYRESDDPKEAIMVDFTDEEGYGRYLDLHEAYERFINLKGQEKTDYLTYLSQFDQFFDVPKERKNASYRDYLELLLDYFTDYCGRVKPLLDLTEDLSPVMKEFEQKWRDGSFPGWPKETAGALSHSGAHLDLSPFASAEELASLGLDRLKSALLALGLKCGGTLEERAQRLFATKGRNLAELDPALFTKSRPGKSIKERDGEKLKEVAALEAQLYHFIEILREQRQDTKDNVQRKQARTGAEREEEDDELGNQSEDDDENEIVWNPKNLPLDWNNKPIPYWLYKLHGLNLYYTCEICGNHTYRGPKAFILHFAEWRHAHGMRCLGIPNTAHFHNVTLIEDALALWEKLKVQKEGERFKHETEEEFEDTMGNVCNRKTFEDLKRQGLL